MNPALSSRKRREILLGLAALAAAGYVPAGWTQNDALTPVQFTALSKALTNFAYADAALASSLLRALASAVGAATLARIAATAASAPDRVSDALKTAGVEGAAAKVIVSLYSGIVETAKGPVVLTYNDALAWQAVPWTKPNALCGGQTDYWAAAPAEK